MKKIKVVTKRQADMQIDGYVDAAKTSQVVGDNADYYTLVCHKLELCKTSLCCPSECA